MSYDKELEKNGITAADIDKLVAAFRQRAAGDKTVSHPDAIYHTAAVDLAMGAVDLHKEVLAGMKDGHSAKAWLAILTGVAL